MKKKRLPLITLLDPNVTVPPRTFAEKASLVGTSICLFLFSGAVGGMVGGTIGGIVGHGNESVLAAWLLGGIVLIGSLAVIWVVRSENKARINSYRHRARTWSHYDPRSATEILRDIDRKLEPPTPWEK